MRHLVLAALVLAAPTAAHADCALTGLVPHVLSRPDVVLAPDGGIVVAAVSEDRGALDSGDVAVQTQWRFAGAKQAIEPAIETLAPGLAVYRAKLETLARLRPARSRSCSPTRRASRSHGARPRAPCSIRTSSATA